MNKQYILFLVFTLIGNFAFSQEQDSSLILFQYNQLPPETKVHDILVNSDNIKFLATTNGIFEITNKNLPPKKISNHNVFSFCFDRTEKIFGLYENGIIDVANNKDISLPEGCVAKDITYNNSNIWLATNSGVYRYNIRSERWYLPLTKRNSKLPNDDVNFIFADKNKKLWIGTKGGIAIMDLDERWKVYEREHSMEAMAYNSEGLWLVSNKEMWLIDDFGRWYTVDLDDGLKKGIVKDITTDKDGRLILASETIVRYNPYDETIYSYSESLGFLSQKANTIEGDLSRDIWVGTEDGSLYVITFTDTQLAPLNAIVEIKQEVNCRDENSGSLQAKAFGGQPPYNFSWNDDEFSGATIRSVPAGSYQLTVTDKINNVFTLDYEFTSDYPINISVSIIEIASNPNRADGKASVTISKGKPPHSIEWDNGVTEETNLELSEGEHTVTVTDDKRCAYQQRFVMDAGKFIPDLNIEKLTVGQTLPINELYFSADSAFVSEASLRVLDEVHEFLEQHPSVDIEIGGHTNNIPPKEYCYKLSTARAKNVSEYLIKKGVQEDRITYKGYGKDFPIADNDTVQGRKLNQRVEIKIVSFEN